MDNETTGKQLLEKGELKRRATIVPLNKISARSLSNDVVQKAKDLVSLSSQTHLASLPNMCRHRY